MKKSREANFELLRIVGMCAIIGMHFLDKGGLMKSSFDGGINHFDLCVRLLEAFLVSGVNIYVMCGAYYLIDKEFSLKRIIRIWGITLFYSILIVVVHNAVGICMGNGMLNDKYTLFMCLTPVISEHYWFVTAYVLLLFIAPALNAGIKAMTKEQFALLLGGLTLILSVAPSIFPLVLPLDKCGMDVLWFILLYMYGAYIKLYGIKAVARKKVAGIAYLIGSLLIFVSFWIVVSIYLSTGKLGDFVTRQYHYNSIFCLIASISLICLFEKIQITNVKVSSLVCKVASVSFAVYLIHEHVVIRYLWTKVLGISDLYGRNIAFVCFVFVVPGLYMVCGFIEWVRKRIYSLIA